MHPASRRNPHHQRRTSMTVFYGGLVVFVVSVGFVLVGHLIQHAAPLVDPVCCRCGARIQAPFRSQIWFDGVRWVCVDCLGSLKVG